MDEVNLYLDWKCLSIVSIKICVSILNLVIKGKR